MRPLPEIAGVKHRWVSAGGLRTHIAEAGDGPPVVLVHGWPQHWFMWHRLIGPLAESHRVICIDLRGFGWTAAPPGGYSPEIMASDIAGLLDALELDRVDLIGHDWGGWTAFTVCLRHPERVHRLLALNVVHPFVRPSPRGVAGLWRFWYQLVIAAPALLPRGIGGRAARLEPALAWVGGGEAGWSDQERETFVAQFRERDRAMAAALLYRHTLFELLPAVIRGDYRRLSMRTPALLLFGTGDRVLNHRLLPGFERNAPNMRLELAPGVGHFIVDQQPGLVLDRARGLFGDP